MKGVFFAISGPSGVGKGTLINLFKEKYKNFYFPVSCTTRLPRPGEVDGVHYFFYSEERFLKAIKEGEFLEWAIVHGKNYYGTLKNPIIKALEEGKVVIREVDMQGVFSYMNVLKRENLVTIFIYPEDIEVLKLRIAKRGQLPEEEIVRRLFSAKKEIEQSVDCDYRIVSQQDKVMECFSEMEKIIVNEMKKRGIEV